MIVCVCVLLLRRGFFRRQPLLVSDTVKLEITNSGTLATDVLLDFTTDGTLTDALWVEIQAIKYGSGGAPKATHNLENAAGSTQIGMYEGAGNECQAKTFNLGLEVTATQSVYEEKGFGDNTYDEDASYVKAYTIEDILGAKENDIIILMNSIYANGKDIDLAYHVNIDLNGYLLRVKSFKIETNDVCTVDIANGTIKAVDGNIEILVQNGTINANDVIFVYDASSNSGDTNITGEGSDNVTGDGNYPLGT